MHQFKMISWRANIVLKWRRLYKSIAIKAIMMIFVASIMPVVTTFAAESNSISNEDKNYCFLVISNNPRFVEDVSEVSVIISCINKLSERGGRFLQPVTGSGTSECELLSARTNEEMVSNPPLQNFAQPNQGKEYSLGNGLSSQTVYLLSATIKRTKALTEKGQGWC